MAWITSLAGERSSRSDTGPAASGRRRPPHEQPIQEARVAHRRGLGQALFRLAAPGQCQQGRRCPVPFLRPDSHLPWPHDPGSGGGGQRHPDALGPQAARHGRTGAGDARRRERQTSIRPLPQQVPPRTVTDVDVCGASALRARRRVRESQKQHCRESVRLAPMELPPPPNYHPLRTTTPSELPPPPNYHPLRTTTPSANA